MIKKQTNKRTVKIICKQQLIPAMQQINSVNNKDAAIDDIRK